VSNELTNADDQCSIVARSVCDQLKPHDLFTVIDSGVRLKEHEIIPDGETMVGEGV
jgi:hypothetical protein